MAASTLRGSSLGVRGTEIVVTSARAALQPLMVAARPRRAAWRPAAGWRGTVASSALDGESGSSPASRCYAAPISAPARIATSASIVVGKYQYIIDAVTKLTAAPIAA